MLVLDISCQHLGDEWKLEGFLVPLEHGVGKYIFWDIIYFGKYILVKYICLLWIYHANTWGMNVSWGVSMCPSGTEWGNIYFGILYILGNIY